VFQDRLLKNIKTCICSSIFGHIECVGFRQCLDEDIKSKSYVNKMNYLRCNMGGVEK
jgi:hypothetical protein